MRLSVGFLLVVAIASQAGGQANDSKPIDVWASLTLGGASIRHEPNPNLSARLSLWGSAGHGVFGLRAAAAAPIFADNFTEIDDFAVLGGVRAAEATNESLGGFAGSFTIGPGVMSSSTHVGGQVERRIGPDPALAVDVDGTLHAHFVGLGVSLFGAISPRAMYTALGFTLSLGKIH